MRVACVIADLKKSQIKKDLVITQILATDLDSLTILGIGQTGTFRPGVLTADAIHPSA